VHHLRLRGHLVRVRLRLRLRLRVRVRARVRVRVRVRLSSGSTVTPTIAPTASPIERDIARPGATCARYHTRTGPHGRPLSSKTGSHTPPHRWIRAWTEVGLPAGHLGSPARGKVPWGAANSKCAADEVAGKAV